MNPLENLNWQILEDRNFVACLVQPKQQQEITQQLKHEGVERFISPNNELLQISVHIEEFSKLRIYPESIAQQVNDAVMSATHNAQGRIVDYKDDVDGLIRAAERIQNAAAASALPVPQNLASPSAPVKTPSDILPQAKWMHNNGISTAVIACPSATSPAGFREKIIEELTSAGLTADDCQVILTDRGVQVSLNSFAYAVAVDKDKPVAGAHHTPQQPARGEEETPPFGTPLPPPVPRRIERTAFRAALRNNQPPLPPPGPPPEATPPFGTRLPKEGIDTQQPPSPAQLPPPGPAPRPDSQPTPAFGTPLPRTSEQLPPPGPAPEATPPFGTRLPNMGIDNQPLLPPPGPPPQGLGTPRDGVSTSQSWRQYLNQGSNPTRPDLPSGPPRNSGHSR